MYNDRTCTVIAYSRISNCYMDIDDINILKDIGYAKELEQRNPIREGVVKRLIELQPEASFATKTDIVRELNSRYTQMGISDSIPKTVRNWLGDRFVVPSRGENVYNLCLALEFDHAQASEFILKNCMLVPFNYKNIVDVAYYYGFLHKLSYCEIKRMIDEVSICQPMDAINDNTQMVRMNIEQFDSQKDFVEYMASHIYKKEQQYSSAYCEIMRLFKQAAQYADKERSQLGLEYLETEARNNENAFPIIDHEGNPVNISAVLNQIYGISFQKQYASDARGIKKSTALPFLFKTGFPADQEFQQIKNHRASPEVYRKALIILQFYTFFASQLLSAYDDEKSEEDIDSDFEDFKMETSALLEKCGFVQLYARNPFDWIMMYCAWKREPIDVFRSIMINGVD